MTSGSTSTTLAAEEVHLIIEKSLACKDFHITDYSLKAISENPMGFNGEHKRLEVNLSVNGEKKKYYYFVKVTPELKIHKDYLEKIRIFYKEIGLYETMFKDMEKARKLAGKVFHPQCYLTKGEELLVFEDLTTKDYYLYPGRVLFDEDHVLASLETIAAMHASSFIFESEFNKGTLETLSPTYKKPISCGEDKSAATIGEVYFHLLFETEASELPDHPGNTVYETGIKAIVELVNYLTGYSKDEKEKIKEKLPDVMRREFQLVKPSKKFKNVIVHGDLWSNNLMFKKDENGKVKHAMILDFQLARFAPPAHDVIMFLHLVQNKEFRYSKRLPLLQYYYNTLKSEVDSNGIFLTDVLTWDEFLESCDFYEELGILTALFFFQLILAPGEITSEFLSSPELFFRNIMVSRNEMIEKCFLEDDIFRKRISESMKELIDKYIL